MLCAILTKRKTIASHLLKKMHYSDIKNTTKDFFMCDLNFYLNVGTLVATSLMALFAWLSWCTAVEQKESQKDLLTSQNKIQQKQLKLALLKEKQEIREDFRSYILSIRDELFDVVYKCKGMSLDQFKEKHKERYKIIMRLGDLFGQRLKHKSDEILASFESILTSNTQEIAKLKLFERGGRHPERERGIEPNVLKDYQKTNDDNMHYLVTANNLFGEVLEEINKNINNIVKELID